MSGDRAEASLRLYLEQMALTPVSVSSVTAKKPAWDVHVRDSLVALELQPVCEASRIADIGAGGGFPGVALAAALPEARVDLIESIGRKCEFMRQALDAAGIGNARPVAARAEDWARGEGHEAYDLVTARAVGPLAALAELASPLLRQGGALVAWKGSRDPAEEEQLGRAAQALAMQPHAIEEAVPYPGSRNRHLHVILKTGPTPEKLPRRPGQAQKRPFGAPAPQPHRDRF